VQKTVGATKDADPFKESDHPRDDDGKFGSGAGGKGPEEKPKNKDNSENPLTKAL
jgi:hypothetical protein